MRKPVFFVVSLMLSLPASLAAMPESEFAACISNLKTEAARQGVSSQVIDGNLARANFVPRVIELDRRQPEFTESFANYIGQRVNEQRIQRGRALLAEHRELLDDIAREYGVPAQYLVSFWGLETNYGSFFGRMTVVDSLATLACDPRRSDYFTGELMGALKIIDEGAIDPSRMEGSWAGAMGHVQFMPSVFLRYAIDYDGSGRRDLWGSVPDAMASAANFLRGIGWQKEQRWGREVLLPDDFAYHLAGLDTSRDLKEWRDMGVKRADGAPLPVADMQASLLVPAGHQGPAFLVYENFHVIMRWNRSQFYALSVGHLADRIIGAGDFQQPPPESPRLSREQIITLQQRLNDKGFDSGEPDGVLGPATRGAISRYQKANNMIADGFPGSEVLSALSIEVPRDDR